MHAALCQADGELPYDVLLEGEQTYDGWDDELYDLISLRQQNATDRTRAMALFYDCIEMLQLVKDTFADLLVRRCVGSLADIEMWTELITPASVTTTSTTPISPASAALVLTTSTSSVVNKDKVSIPTSAVTAPVTASIPISSFSAPMTIHTSTLLLSKGETPSVNSGWAWQRELFAQGRAVRRWEEGLPLHVEIMDRLRLSVSKLGGCQTLEEGQGFDGGFEVRLQENDEDYFANDFCASSTAIAHAVRSDDAFQDKNINKCDDQISNHNKIADGFRVHGSVFGLVLISPPFRFFVGNAQGREGWGIVAGRWEVGWSRVGVG
ncbi:hypothetical protein CBR_g3584 [Chara braunii]|uniref:Uncharacterized protein n=1 Tax=Chara braunii TaxID=69332 RepID=A0A388KFU3_CHABU|nr:hypothetical protein CBR_g3584 [Chara braunii]|eukprot:GBG68886.1 hypothetical protein CBR_g3584 [Chara braunii]